MWVRYVRYKIIVWGGREKHESVLWYLYCCNISAVTTTTAGKRSYPAGRSVQRVPFIMRWSCRLTVWRGRLSVACKYAAPPSKNILFFLELITNLASLTAGPFDLTRHATAATGRGAAANLARASCITCAVRDYFVVVVVVYLLPVVADRYFFFYDVDVDCSRCSI